MAETDQEFPWLSQATVQQWLKVDSSADAQKVARIQVCRKAAARWVEDQRRDLIDHTVPTSPVFPENPRLVMAGVLAAARLYARVDSPNGVVAFDELGAGAILSKDPDVARYLGRAKFRVG